MKILKHLAFASLLGILVASCSQKVVRVNPDEAIDLDGTWNEIDSKQTSDELTRQMFTEPWLQNFKDENNKKPVLIVGFVTNKSSEHIEAETFIKDIERATIREQKARLVQGGEKREQIRLERADQQNNSSKSTMKKWGLEVGADFMLQGTINSIEQASKNKVKGTKYYQVNLELTHIQTNEIVWVGEKKIKKFTKR